jgi:hypothetical protein
MGRLAREAESPRLECFTYHFFLHFVLFRSRDSPLTYVMTVVSFWISIFHPLM